MAGKRYPIYIAFDHHIGNIYLNRCDLCQEDRNGEDKQQSQNIEVGFLSQCATGLNGRFEDTFCSQKHMQTVTELIKLGEMW